jgi:hypothetical protein
MVPRDLDLQDSCRSTRAVEKCCRSQDHVGEQTRHYMQHRLVLGIGDMRLGYTDALRY